MLKRSYRGFVLWMAGYFALMISASFLPIKDNELQARIFYFLTAASIEVLMLIVYKTEKVFWINGIRYEDAVEAGSERRKALALRYVKRFGSLTLGIFLFSVGAQLLKLPCWVDLCVVIVAFVGCAFSTIRFKL